MSTLPALASAARRHPARTNLLVWHDFVPEGTKQVWFDTGVREFSAQLDRILHAGAKPIPIDALYAWLATGRNEPAPGSMVFCFDDNTLGIYEYAFPEMKRRGFPFAISAHSRYVGVHTGKMHCTWAQLREMEASGLARVVSQTHNHPPDLRTLTDTELQAEMQLSKRLHEQNLGREARFLTYPSGKWDTRVAMAAAQAGYRMALTEDHGTAETSPHLLGIHRWSTHRRFTDGVAAIRQSS